LLSATSSINLLPDLAGKSSNEAGSHNNLGDIDHLCVCALTSMFQFKIQRPVSWVRRLVVSDGCLWISKSKRFSKQRHCCRWVAPRLAKEARSPTWLLSPYIWGGCYWFFPCTRAVLPAQALPAQNIALHLAQLSSAHVGG
jgi:hypothetical protein